MERFAILNKSMPSTAGATIRSRASPSQRRTSFTTSRGSIPDGKRFFQENLSQCSLLALIAHLSPQNLLALHLIYQLSNATNPPCPQIFLHEQRVCSQNFCRTTLSVFG